MIFSRENFIKTLAGILFFLCSIASLVSGQELSADELVKKIDDLLRGESSYMEMKMTVYNPDWARPRSFEMYAYESRAEGKAFIRITAPSRDRGCGFLKIGYNLWMFVPRTERVMKIPPSMMHQSWMGSDFTNDDLVRESSIVNDYEHRLIKVEDHPEGGKVYLLELLPKPEAPVVWGRILLWVWDEGFIPTKEQFFDEEGRMINEMIFSEIKEKGGRRIPTLWEMRPMTKPGHKTVLQILEANFDIEIDPGIFTEKRLKRKN
jgi:outer membrane lipoprotein-sorting protein